MHGTLRATWVYFLLATVRKVYSEPQVYILSENLEQVVTSSTLQWISYNDHAEALLRNAVVAAYQIKEVDNSTGDVPKTTEEIFKVPVYVCRAKVAALWVPGQFRNNEKVCIVSSYRKVSEEKNFEILINKEKRSRLSWAQKSKYTITPQGSVEGGEKVYIARRTVKYHHKEGALTHTVGNFNPSENLGVFSLVDQNNKELKYEDGEILVEQEPIRYEFKHSKFNKIKSKHIHSPKILGTTILKNEEQDVQRVDTVLSFNYTHYMNWGKEHGLLIALPFSVDLPNGTKFSGKWGIPESVDKTEVVPIERYLEEGTAVNVTLKGNYTESDIPYVATVTAYYKDNESLDSILRDSLLKKHMTGVVIEYSPVYFLGNNTLVPTTTTTARTTSITTQTTQTQTITVKVPNTDDIYLVDEKSEKPISNSVVPNELPSNELPSDSSGNTNDNTVQQLTKKDERSIGSKISITYILLILTSLVMQIT